MTGLLPTIGAFLVLMACGWWLREFFLPWAWEKYAGLPKAETRTPEPLEVQFGSYMVALGLALGVVICFVISLTTGSYRWPGHP